MLLLLAAAWLVAGCKSGPPLNLPPGASVLHLAAADDVPTLDPALGYDTASWTFEQAIFDTLVRYGDANVELEPDLALSWEISKDATNLTFHLRRDARFSNGRPVTGADFKYAIERVLRPSTRSKGTEYYRGIVGAEDFIAGRARQVSGIEVPDPYTIVFRLNGPDPIFIHKLTMPFAAAVPREDAEKWGEDFSHHVVGSGAFKLFEWISGQRLVVVRNPYYFAKGLPRLDAVVELMGVNDELEWLKYEAGEIDVSTITPPEFPRVMKSPTLKALTIRTITVTTDYLGMNCQMPPFTDVRVRQAFNYAIDKRKLLALLNGRGVVARGVLPPGLPGYTPDVAGYPYDPEKARRLLEEAGVRKDFAPVLWMRADQTMLLLGQSVQQDLALVGIDVALKPVAWGPLLEAIREPRNVDLFMLAWEADFPDPENFLEVLLSKQQWGSNNDTFFYNPEFDRLLNQAAPIADFARRFELYRKAERIIIAQAPWVFLYHPVSYVIRQPWVHDYVLNPMRPSRFEKVWFSPAQRPAPQP
ncbi:MAG TPA: ABC transporter substrate-binding protein [Candidatus Binataceae bacterium]|nr:ABC transporter substrate-binding protein [Candidatus Binataceae bacterium]